MSMLSVIIPAYNEAELLRKTAGTVKSVLAEAGIENEIIFVDDGSGDGTWEIIKAISEAEPGVRGVHFSRNFGKEAAIMAGLEAAAGDCCAVIDCDLQHPPEKLVEMHSLWCEGYEVIEGRKRSRGKESVFHSLAAKTFYKLIGGATGVDMENVSDFKLLDRKAVDVLINMRERNAFFRALSSWIGFKTAYVEFDVREREAGQSKWSNWALTKYAVNNITAFSSAPMQIVTVLGAIMLIVSLVFGIVALVQKISGTALGGFTTVILLLLFTGSIIMLSLGIIGVYISRIYEEIKGRPKFIVSETCGEREEVKV